MFFDVLEVALTGLVFFTAAVVFSQVVRLTGFM
jgi:hypothetical protein